MVRLAAGLTFLVSLTLLAGHCEAGSDGASMSEALVTYKPGAFSEFIVAPDGDILLFPASYDGRVVRWRDGKWQESTALYTEGRVCDAVPGTNSTWMLLSAKSQTEVILYKYQDGKLQLLTRVEGKFEKPALHAGADGTLWILSAEGVAYGMKGAEKSVHEFGPALRKENWYVYYPSTEAIEVPGRGTWFWSHFELSPADFGYDKPAIDGFHVYDGETWRIVSCLGDKLGGAVLATNGVIICGTRYKGVYAISKATEDVTHVFWRLPYDEHCVLLHAMPRGRFLAITAPLSSFMRMPPRKRGWIGSLLAVERNTTSVLLNGVDFRQVCRDKSRPVVDVEGGTFLATAQAGLLFVSADCSTVRRIDWRHGFPLPNADRMRVAGDRLYLLDRERGFAVVDWRSLLTQEELPSSGNWEVWETASDAYTSSEGAFWYVTVDETSTLVRSDGLSETTYPLQDREFPVNSLWYITSDTKGRIWLISNFETHRTAFLENGSWRTFDLRETAYSTVALEEKGNPGFQIGGPTDSCFPAFAGDGRVAYRNEWSRICYFDGEKWDYGYGDSKIDGRSPDGPPWYSDGVLTASAGGTCYQLVGGAWKAAHKDTNPSYANSRRGREEIELSKSFPGDPARCSVRLRDSDGTVWAGTVEDLFRGVGDVWVRFPTMGTPLRMGQGISQVLIDRAGGLWFTLTGGDYRRLAYYRSRGVLPRLQWESKPVENATTGTVAFSVCIAGKAGRHVVSWKCDDGEWNTSSSDGSTDRIVLKHLTNGSHTCRIAVYDDLLRKSEELTHRFEITRDYETEIKNHLAILKSGTSRQREDAVRALVEIGKPALSALETELTHADPDRAWWIKATLGEIRGR